MALAGIRSARTRLLGQLWECKGRQLGAEVEMVVMAGGCAGFNVE